MAATISATSGAVNGGPCPCCSTDCNAPVFPPCQESYVASIAAEADYSNMGWHYRWAAQSVGVTAVLQWDEISESMVYGDWVTRNAQGQVAWLFDFQGSADGINWGAIEHTYISIHKNTTAPCSWGLIVPVGYVTTKTTGQTPAGTYGDGSTVGLP